MEIEITKIVLAFAEYYDKTLSETQIQMFVEDLMGLSPDQLKMAVKKYRMDPANVFFPLPAKLIEIAATADGRPGVEEAWSMMPKSEHDSIVWTQEMATAYGVVHSLLEDDPIAARMAFKEKYSSLLREARSNGTLVKWSLTGGYDKSGREAALRIAIQKNQIGIELAEKLMPEIAFNPNVEKVQINHEVRAEVLKLIGSAFSKGTS